MIESIQISDVATYSNVPENLIGLSRFNFLYGSNGSGKTTISRVIADEGKFPTCSVIWKEGTKLQAMVYNHDFVTKNFSPSAELKGIFTLGEKNVETLNKIATAKGELDSLTKILETLNVALQGEDGTGGKKGELAVLDEEFKNKCWAQKQKHDAKLAGAFEGYRGSAEKFKGKVLQERTANSATLETLEDIEKKAETVFGQTPVSAESVPPIEADKVVTHESNPILKKRVLGKDDVDIAAMIKKLGNSDWVREGRAFYEENESVCPFCQQSTTEVFAHSLNEYFDETFVTDIKAIDDLVTDYTTDAARLQQQIASLIGTSSKFLDVEKVKTEKDLLDSKVTINRQRLASKRKEPSQIVELESISNVASTIKSLVTFLYFYHLLKGSDSETGMTTDRIVVIDDPVSSLDSDILFIVGSLIKGLFDEVRAGTGHIKQIFVLTHNVYFHKEVTFNPRRSNNEAMKSEETFWVVRKSDLSSKVEKHNANPIKTSYELLWSEVRRPDRSNLTIQNTLRRILENYFKILGGVDPDKICALFEGREKLIGKSLFSWVNDGSHFAHDDLYVSIDDSVVETYLKVFRAIFEKSDHLAHYKMMMGDAYVDSPIQDSIL